MMNEREVAKLQLQMIANKTKQATRQTKIAASSCEAIDTPSMEFNIESIKKESRVKSPKALNQNFMDCMTDEVVVPNSEQVKLEAAEDMRNNLADLRSVR